MEAQEDLQGTEMVFEPFSHKRQVEFLERLKHLVGGILDQKLISDIQKSVLDSKSHAVMSDSQIHITLPLNRYRNYMDFVVASEQDYTSKEDLLASYAKFLKTGSDIFNPDFAKKHGIK